MTQQLLMNLTAGILHCFFEGYFVINHNHMGPSQDLFGQLWKEYAKSDSRYLIVDPFVLSIEAVTVVSVPIDSIYREATNPNRFFV